VDQGEAITARFRIRTLIADAAVFTCLESLIPCLAAPALAREWHLLVHGCLMVPPGGGGAILFTGPSGAGKTSMLSRLPGWTSLGDDTALVDLTGPIPQVSGTLLAGKEEHPRVGTPHVLSAVVGLSPGAEALQLQTLTGAQAFSLWMERVFWYLPESPLVKTVTDLAAQLAESVPGYRLESSLSHDLQSLGLEDLVGGGP